MAVRAELEAKSEVLPAPKDRHDPTAPAIIEQDEVQITAARLYGHGYTRQQIEKILFDHLAPAKRPGQRDRTLEERQRMARGKLRRWEGTASFRDLVWEQAVVDLDMQTPAILKGIGKKARHRVDAARLALEVAGRHNPRGEHAMPNITVQIANLPRPE